MRRRRRKELQGADLGEEDVFGFWSFDLGFRNLKRKRLEPKQRRGCSGLRRKKEGRAS